MIFPVGTKVKVRKGAVAFIYEYEGPNSKGIPSVRFTTDEVTEDFTGTTVDVDFRRDLRDPKTTTKIVNQTGKFYLFTDSIAERWIESE